MQLGINLDVNSTQQDVVQRWGFEPTQEQLDIIEEFATGDNPVCCVQAGAGASKTTTLLMVAERLATHGLRGVYTAFNKLIVVEGKSKFDPAWVTASTIHSLAYRATDKRYLNRLPRKGTKSMFKGQIASFLGVTPIKLEFKNVADDGASTFKNLGKVDVVSMADETVRVFCNSGDTEIGHQHVPLVRKYGKLPKKELIDLKKQMQDKVVEYAKALWLDVTSLTGSTPFKHHHYLKMWELGNPIVNADYLAVDEGQDLNPVMLSIMEKNVTAGIRVIIVGDSSQSIYSFTGAIDALEYVMKKGVKPLPLSKSFRFGPPIADVANQFLGELGAFTIEGAAAHESSAELVPENFYENVDALLVRTNAGGLEAYMTITEHHPDRAIHLNVDTGEIFDVIDGITALQEGLVPKHYELMNYEKYEDLLEDIENEAIDYQIILIHQSMKKYGGNRMKAKLYSMARAEECDLHILTAHKSKGCEWDNVAIYSDFTLSDAAINTATAVPAEYLRLCYVAITRAKRNLAWEPLHDFKARIQLIRDRLEGGDT